MSDNVALHFYPGDKKLLFLKNGNVELEAEAWGGPSNSVKTGYIMNMGPTDAGTYVIYSVAPYRTNTWPLSRIKWGTALTFNGLDVLFEESIGKWSSATAKTGLTKEQIKGLYADLYGKAGYPTKWLFNDFGPLSIRYFKDKNNNRKLDKDESLSGEMFHTTPVNEAQEARGLKIEMEESHGCIHLKPHDRDIFIAANAFTSGTTLIIHKYTEHPKP